MIVTLVNTYLRGGAATACIRLHKGLLQQGVDSRLLYQNDNLSAEVSRGMHKWSAPANQLRATDRIYSLMRSVLNGRTNSSELQAATDHFFRTRPKGLELFSYPHSNFDLLQSDVYAESDIVNLHWVAQFIDIPTFFAGNCKPLVWTLHDMNPFLGGEHYRETYYGIAENGRPIKRQCDPREIRESNHLQKIKKKVYRQADELHVVSPSQWLCDEAMHSDVMNVASYNVIPYGLDTNVFTMRPKPMAREVLGLPQNRPIVLFIADNIDNQRKGFAYLRKALDGIIQKHVDVLFCSVGRVTEPVSGFHQFGFVRDERLLSIIYSAADLFVIPSLMDNLPNTVLESLCCGTPVVGFNIGGIPDMVEHGVNGLLCDEISVHCLQETICEMLLNLNHYDNGRIASEASRKYNMDVQADAYLHLFERIINGV